MTGPPGGGRDVLGDLHLAWVEVGDLPDGDAWLTAAEREVRDGLVVEKRRTDWLLGRLAAKRAVSDALGGLESLARVEVLADESGRPRARVDGVQSAPAVSISHSSGTGFAAAAMGGSAVGCDIEAVASRSEAFVADYFTAPERAAVATAADPIRPVLANLIWSGKESALKVLGEGLRVDTRVVTVETSWLSLDDASWPTSSPGHASGWTPLWVRAPSGILIQGYWRVGGGLVWTVLAGGSPASGE